jgi:tRNA (guanine-N7-)-methyltransferase
VTEVGADRKSALASDSISTLIFRPESYFQRLDLACLFSRIQPLEVELGSGDGSFLAQHARAHPEHNFVGVERLLGRLRKIDRKGLRERLTNLRLLRIEAGYFLEYLLPSGSVHGLHVYFPDPWPKRKHHRHRLVNPRFAELVWKALEPEGSIYFRTDNTEYFAQITKVFQENPLFQARETPPGLASIPTDFEREFHARGIATFSAAYQRGA